VRRRWFVVALGSATGCALFGLDRRSAAQPFYPSGSLRVRLFAELSIVKLCINDAVVDADAATMTQDATTASLGDGVLEFSANSPLQVTATAADGTNLTRWYAGTIFVTRRQTELLAINQVDVETYVASVLSAEVSPNWAYQSLCAQAIAARTYAAHALESRTGREYDLRDDTSNQVYPGISSVAAAFINAAHDTAGRILTYAGLPASVFYSSSCGGHTASSEELTGLPAPPYLVGVADTDRRGRAYCAQSPYFRWTNSVSADAMARVIGLPVGALSGIEVTERWPDGRAKSVVATGSPVSVTLSGREFYQRALGILGYKVIPSALFDISRSGSDFTITGHGVGHGVGMCQWGARGRAEAGMTAEQILQAYFPGTVLT
jgi:stage II sporulation protein D